MFFYKREQNTCDFGYEMSFRYSLVSMLENQYVGITAKLCNEETELLERYKAKQATA